MLASLLPGLRDVRTPLATGYLYAFLLWLIFGNNLLPDQRPNELFERMADLSEIIGTGATLAALSFAAYLIGSILVVKRLPFGLDLRQKGARLYTDDVINWVVEQADGLAARSWSVQNLFDRDDIPQGFRGRLKAVVDQVAKDDGEEAAQSLDLTDVNQSRSLFFNALAAEANESHDALVTRLQIERETLFGEYDRVRTEAELRFSVIPPLIGVIVAAAILWSPWATAMLFLPMALFVQGFFLQRDSIIRIELALARGVITLPILDLLADIGSPKSRSRIIS